jgi:hypothetical protein
MTNRVQAQALEAAEAAAEPGNWRLLRLPIHPDKSASQAVEAEAVTA